MSWDHVIDRIIDREGSRYTNHPADRGGPTRWGITLATLKRACNANATAEDVRCLSEDTARDIYRQRYVEDPGFDAVAAQSARVAAELIDSGVNVGTRRASRWLQVALNAGLDPRVDLLVDGICGDMTIDALRQYLAAREHAEDILLAMLNAQQGDHYLRLTRINRDQRVFVNGWFLQRVVPGLQRAAA